MALMVKRCLIAISICLRLVPLRETGQRINREGGLERNSRERPNRIVFLTQLSEAVESHLSKKKDKRPPMWEGGGVLARSTKGTSPPTPGAPLGGVTRERSNLSFLLGLSPGLIRPLVSVLVKVGV